MLAATGNRYQLDLVEQAMKIRFADDEKRNHDDRTGKYHNNILRGAVGEDDDLLCGTDEGLDTTEEDLDALATAQEGKSEENKLWLLWPQPTER